MLRFFISAGGGNRGGAEDDREEYPKSQSDFILHGQLQHNSDGASSESTGDTKHIFIFTNFTKVLLIARYT